MEARLMSSSSVLKVVCLLTPCTSPSLFGVLKYAHCNLLTSFRAGDAQVQTSKVSESVFVKSGNNPFELIQEAIR